MKDSAGGLQTEMHCGRHFSENNGRGSSEIRMKLSWRAEGTLSAGE